MLQTQTVKCRCKLDWINQSSFRANRAKVFYQCAISARNAFAIHTENAPCKLECFKHSSVQNRHLETYNARINSTVKPVKFPNEPTHGFKHTTALPLANSDSQNQQQKRRRKLDWLNQSSLLVSHSIRASQRSMLSIGHAADDHLHSGVRHKHPKLLIVADKLKKKLRKNSTGLSSRVTVVV